MCKTNYKQWTLIGYEKMDDYNAYGVHFKHAQTGTEVFHLVNDDEENLFAFGFKTLSENSCGTAHILEHSVLCGSKNYPLKDPFMQLSSQSVKTFLNAMTFPDKTVYPASSVVEADYFNVMAVYGDAVFFPLLSEHVFSQEAHRFELDDDGTINIQGVVYNEMKGNYSSFESVVGDYILQSMFPDTSYRYDSGGDPEKIPLLTHQQLKDFHAKYYNPANCKIFLCGNIQTEKQLDFIEEHFLTDFIENTEKSDFSAIVNTPHAFEKPKTLSVPGPGSDEEKGATVLLNWALGASSDTTRCMEAVLITEILMGHDGSPLAHALLDSKLGEDIAPNSGLEGEMSHLMFSFGMRGVEKENIEKLQKCIIDVLEDLVKNGIPQEHIDAAMMSIDFSHREVRRSHGPWALVLMRRAMRGWFNGTDPFSPLKTRDAFEKIKQKILSENNGSYLKNLIKKFFLENNHRLLLIVTPDKAYDEERKAKEQNFIKNCPDSKEILLQKKQLLQEFQQSGDDEKTRSLIPHLKPSQFSEKIDCIKTQSVTMGDVPAFLHNEATNGIVYLDVAIPVDVLDAELYPYLPFFAIAVTNCGFSDFDWKQAANHVGQNLGGFRASLLSSSATAWGKTQKTEDDCLMGRDWIFIRSKMLAEKAQEGIDIVFDCLKNPVFSDSARLNDLVLEFKNDFSASLVPAGHEYALSRSAHALNHAKTVDELWNGFSQLYTCRSLAGKHTDELYDTLTLIHEKLMTAGIVLNITADNASIEAVQEIVTKQAQSFTGVKARPVINNADFLHLADIPPANDDNTDIFPIIQKNPQTHSTDYIIQSQTAFSAAVFKASPFGTKEAVYESLFAHWFSNNILWEEIRTKGGAYGGFSFTDSVEELFAFVSYRDPDPHRSLEVFERCLQNAAKIMPDEPILERIISGCYSKEIQPRSPVQKGFVGFIRRLYGIRDEDRQEKLKILLRATAEDIQKAAQNIARDAHKAEKSIVCGQR
ncbi:MAG: insulinase family protein [Spirochaetales bacterium]